jgi:DNA-binding LytR/AlgR family response regulator
LKIAILDDSKEDLRQIKSVISSYYESLNTSADIRLYSSAESFFAKYSPGFYDLIIMDIYMGTMTGMDAKDTAALIFITSSDAYAVESYDVQASYYLMKPFDPEKLCRILSTIQLRQSQNSRYIELISDRTPVKIPVRSILYVDTYRNAIQVHTTDAGIIRSYMTFQKFEEILDGMKCFLSCYRGCIVNMDHIEEITGEGFLMDSKELVTVRKRGSNAIKKAYLEYLFSSDSDK